MNKVLGWLLIILSLVCAAGFIFQYGALWELFDVAIIVVCLWSGIVLLQCH